MPKMIFVNLPVADVEKSVAFYEAIGFTKDERFSQPGRAGAMVWSDTIVFMILSHAHFADFTSKRIVDAKSEVEALLCLSLDSRQDVDAIVEKAVRRRRQGRPRTQTGSRLHVRPQLRGPRRPCVRADVDGCRGGDGRDGLPADRSGVNASLENGPRSQTINGENRCPRSPPVSGSTARPRKPQTSMCR